MLGQATGAACLPELIGVCALRRAFNSSHVRARCNLGMEEFKRGKGRGKAAGGKARGSQGAGDELVEGGDLEEQTAAAAAAEVLSAPLAGCAECTSQQYAIAPTMRQTSPACVPC